MKVRTWLAISAWALLAVAVAQQQTLKRVSRSYKPPTCEERIAQIDKGIRTALEDLTPVRTRMITFKDKQGNLVTRTVPASFGLSRAPTILIDHDGSSRDTRVPMFNGAGGFDLRYYAVSCLGKPLQKGKMTFHKNFGLHAVTAPANLSNEIVLFAEKSLSSLRRNQEFKGEIEGLGAEAHPLFLSKSECLPCHTGSKIGDPLAVIVYTFKRTKA